MGEVDRINRGLEREHREIDAGIGQAEQEIAGERGVVLYGLFYQMNRS